MQMKKHSKNAKENAVVPENAPKNKIGKKKSKNK